jgi:hypothetical protein
MVRKSSSESSGLAVGDTALDCFDLLLLHCDLRLRHLGQRGARKLGQEVVGIPRRRHGVEAVALVAVLLLLPLQFRDLAGGGRGIGLGGSSTSLGGQRGARKLGQEVVEGAALELKTYKQVIGTAYGDNWLHNSYLSMMACVGGSLGDDTVDFLAIHERALLAVQAGVGTVHACSLQCKLGLGP